MVYLRARAAGALCRPLFPSYADLICLSVDGKTGSVPTTGVIAAIERDAAGA